jgi:hypothetical protein
METTTDWLEAIGACAGAGLTGGALLIAAVNYVRQTTDRQRAQVDRISAWAFQLDGPGVSPFLPVSGVKVLNTSGRAAYQCFGEIIERDTGQVFRKFHTRVLPPSEPMHFVASPPTDVLNGKPDQWVVEITFFDQAERRWHRNGAGKLTLLYRPPCKLRRALARLTRRASAL